MNFLLVGLGGAIGSILRYGTTLLAMRLFGSALPYGTILVNVIGSFLIGLGAVLIARRFGASEPLRLLFLTGFLGGYTTFSAFSLDAVHLYERGAVVSAVVYVVGSVLLGLAALLLGVALARQIG